MIAQSGERKGEYKIENINLEFEAINGNVISRQTSDGFKKGRHLYYSYIQSPNNQDWGKDETHKIITVNIPRKRLRGIIVLFREEGNEDSEHFANANIESVKVRVEGEANQVYNSSIQKSYIYKETVRSFGNKQHPEDNVIEIDFLKSKYALVVDFRKVNEKNVLYTGRNLVGNQAGVLLEITKKATAKDLVAHIFYVSDATASIRGQEVNLTLNR